MADLIYRKETEKSPPHLFGSALTKFRGTAMPTDFSDLLSGSSGRLREEAITMQEKEHSFLSQNIQVQVPVLLGQVI